MDYCRHHNGNCRYRAGRLNAKSITTWTPILVLVGHFGRLPCKPKCHLIWTVAYENYKAFLPLFFRIDSPSKLNTWDR